MTKDEGIKQLTDRYLDLYCYAFGVLKNKADAEDVVQEAITITLSRVLLRNPYGFCVRVLQRRCVDLMRQKGTNLELKDLESAEESVENESKAIEAMKALKDLPPPLKNLVEMHDLEGLSMREISEKTGINLSTIKKRIIKAHKILKEKLS